MITDDYDYSRRLQDLWQQAVDAYRDGIRDSEAMFDADQSQFIASIGARPQEIYDFAEDWVADGAPDYTCFALICELRRQYFIFRQQRRFSGLRLDPNSLPEKSASAEGIEWLPRIIPKAKAKLRGELPDSLMYACGGDRRFLEQHGIHPASFLRLVELHEDDDAAIIRWVVWRAKTQTKQK